MDQRTATRRVALGTLVVGLAAFVLLASTRVPWHPVAGGMPDPGDASTVFSADQIARAEHLARWSRTWSWSSLAVSLVVACWLGFGRTGRALAGRVPGWWWVRIVVVVAALAVVGRLVTLPFALAYQQLRLDEGLATGSWSAWTLDLVKGEAVGVVSTSIALIVLIGCARRWSRLWPIIAGGIAAGLVVGGSFAYPLVVEPLFNQFESLPSGSLRTEVLALAEREGVDVDDVLVADASRRTTTLNAYVSGFGDSRRVVLYDTLVDDTPQDETLSVVAHELAHAKYDDVLTGTLLGAAGALVAFGLLGLLMPGGVRAGRGTGAYDAAGAEDVERLDARAVPRLLALAALATLLAAPVQNGISRQLESRADQTALTVTDDPGAFIQLQERLADRSHADPTPPAWSQWWFGSHPTVLERIAVGERARG